MQRQYIKVILNYLTMGYWKIAVAIFSSRQSVFPSEVPHLSPQTSNMGKYCKLTKPINTGKYWQVEVANTRKYWLVEVIENDCIVTRVGVYDEKSPEPSGNPSGWGDISSYTPPLVTIQLNCHCFIIFLSLDHLKERYIFLLNIFLNGSFTDI